MKHTPGPFTIHDHGQTIGVHIRSEKRHWSLAVVHSTNGCSDPQLDVKENEAFANAALFAAAPDLLEACKEALETIGKYEYPVTADILMKAIAKAATE